MLHARFGNHSDTMSRLSRRSFLAASALLAARPAFAAKPTGEAADVIVVGAGAARTAARRAARIMAPPPWKTGASGAPPARNPELKMFLAAQARPKPARREPTKAKTD